MDLESLREFCMCLTGSTEDIKWEDNLCFLVADKIYVLCSLTPPHRINLKCDKNEFRDLTARDGIQQAPHFARGQWVQMADLATLPPTELQERIKMSRALVLSKLPKKQQANFLK